MRRAKILLVDDEVAFANNISKLISKRGYDIITVYNGESAVQAVDEQDFDVIVLDLKMPGMDGMAALKLIKGKKPGVEVIILTGHGSFESGIDGMQLGAFDFIMKPVRFDDLYEKIRQAYQRKLIIEESGTSSECRWAGTGLNMTEPIRVCLIDDERIFVESLTKVLKKRGMEVQAAFDGLSALKLLSVEEPDVIVLDLRMPGMDGLAVLQEIRAKDSQTPVILLTGHLDIDRVVQVMDKGVALVLLKPCPVETLVSAIENASESKAISKEVIANHPKG